MTRIRTAAIGAAAVAVAIGAFAAAPAVNAAEGDTDIRVGDFDAAVENLHELSTESVAPSAVSDSPSISAETKAVDEDCIEESGDEELVIQRISGANRYETAACVSFGTWPNHDNPDVEEEAKAQVVVLARADNFPDALAGGPLAAYYEGPLLLTHPEFLPDVAMSEIERVLAPGGKVYLLGGTSSVSNDIRDDLQDAGYSTERLSGSNRYETAIAIAEELPNTSNFFFATGENFPDALAAGNAAAALSFSAKYAGDPDFRPFAVLLTQGDELGDSTFDFVLDRGNQFGVWTLITAGGHADRAAEAAFGPGNLGVRFVGSNRFDTAAQIADAVFTFEGELIGIAVGIATGLKFPDALAATSHLGRWGEPLLLTLDDHPSSETIDFLESVAGQGIALEVYGGNTTVSDDVAEAAWQAFR